MEQISQRGVRKTKLELKNEAQKKRKDKKQTKNDKTRTHKDKKGHRGHGRGSQGDIKASKEDKERQNTEGHIDTKNTRKNLTEFQTKQENQYRETQMKQRKTRPKGAESKELLI